MSDITLILLGAGSATRFKLEPKKQWIYSKDKPIWLMVADNFDKLYDFKEIIIVSSADDIEYMKFFGDYKFIVGGDSRQESLKNALKHTSSTYILVSDIARCCIDKDMIGRVMSQKGKADCIVPALSIVDTLYINGKPIDRSKAKQIQTPQLSNTHILKSALSSNIEYTDESSAVEAISGTILFVEGSSNAHKLTVIEDLDKLSCLNPPSNRTISGFGIDIHPFENNKKMFLCGVEIDEVNYGFKAHSDGDVAIHALIDALLGASGLGDIGELFPDTDKKHMGIDSKELLILVVSKINAYGFTIGNVDISIIAQAPRLLKYKDSMRISIAKLLGIRANFVNIKATTAEQLGFLGRKEGIAVEAIANLTYFDWKNK
ncbi:MAG: bifunctional 2-C-methyl-D-erythritol 4-phosphate cytidylyltransferase/2-C-methyl-D-erythritol 2,4-cyclodiphosphate synthase [Sulfurovum sp.]|nr:bifunctional 2-C-methyl-D-erythritol 4-phosphate cytidylyltransferase/2-C-methyl-D-erythritol 2,4-cyclodiphosphate synthase [Sulfurovaceae bacterium]